MSASLEWSSGTSKGNNVMAIRLENLARHAAALVGAAALSILLIANSISVGPLA